MAGLFKGLRPDITPAQILGMIPATAELGHAFGIFNLTQPQQDSLTKFFIAGLALFGVDAFLRVGRAHAQAKVDAAIYTPAEPPSSPPPFTDPETDVSAGELPDDKTELASPPPPA